MVPSESEHLPRRGGNVTDAAAYGQGDEDTRHGRRAGVAVGRVVEDLDERVAGRCAESSVDVPEAEAEGDEHDIAKDAVENHGPHHCVGKDVGSVFDLFG